jgi:flavin-dependent thymidylate synthase
LGAAAACNAIYDGKVKRSLSDVTRAEREAILPEMAKTILTTPMEAISLHFLIEGVTRGFTHQLVRNRTSGYAQESMRFAVVGEKQALPVALPPSLVGGRPLREDDERVCTTTILGWGTDQARRMAMDLATPIDRARWSWDEAISGIQDAYQHLVNSGIPAEDARGMLPTNIQTRIHWVTNLRSLKMEAGKRLSTQAQFEWKAVIAAIARAIREYNPYAQASNKAENLGDGDLAIGLDHLAVSESWQYAAISDLFRPICYQTGKCEFNSSIDRSCTIRDRVEANAARSAARLRSGTSPIAGWVMATLGLLLSTRKSGWQIRRLRDEDSQGRSLGTISRAVPDGDGGPLCGRGWSRCLPRSEPRPHRRHECIWDNVVPS